MKKNSKILIRTATVAGSLNFLKGQLRWLNEEYKVIAVAAGLEKLNQISKSEGIRTEEVVMARHISLLQDLKSLFAMIRLFRKEKPCIVHSMTPKAGLISMIAAKLTGVPIRIHTFTGLVFPTSKGLRKKVLMCTDAITCWCATKVIPEGNGVKNDLINHKITKKPLELIHNGNVAGIDLDYFNPEIFKDQRLELRGKYGLSCDDFVFVFIGRLVKDKGINELIAAFKQLNHANAKLLLVGSYEKELDPLLPETMTEIERNPNIIEVGYQNDIRPWLAVSDALVFPSYREGFPNVVLEAGAMGLPSIVTDINGSNEIIIHEFNGIIVPSKDISALKKGMASFIKENGRVKFYASNARTLIASRFKREDVWKATLEMYRKEEAKILDRKKL
ncbi:glycosyltransferase family 4 protein [Porphyromonadaceae bacterium W3.11]|nr:glycosyltransferase family 4 protein [Porphyromonadaceae bacterium W3.11]